MTPRQVSAIAVLGTALTLFAFGVVRGTMATGPAHGTRLIVSIDPPLDRDALELAEHVVRERVGTDPRVVASGGRVIVEVAADDPKTVDLIAALLERPAKLELYASSSAGSLEPGVVLDGRSIRRAAVALGGVAIEVRDAAALANLRAGQAVAFVLDGRAGFVGTPDRIVGVELHVPIADTAKARELVTMIEAGAAHPAHVVHREAFARATGFWPRARTFLALALALLGVAALLWWRGARH